MLWVYGHYKNLNSFSAGTVFIRQILTYKDGSRTDRVTVCVFFFNKRKYPTDAREQVRIVPMHSFKIKKINVLSHTE